VSGKKERRSSIRWDELPHARWAIEISRRCRFRAQETAHLDARRLLLRGRLRLDESIHHEFMSHEAGEVISELRACRDIYRSGLIDANKTLSIKTPRETLCYYAVEYAVVPRAASLIRASLRHYFEFANIPFDAVQLLFDRHAGCILLPMRQRTMTEERKPTAPGAKTQATTIEPANGWLELLQRMIPNASLQGFSRKSSFLSGEPFHIGLVVHRSTFQYKPGLIPELLDLYRTQEWWMSHAGFLWDSIVEEIKRQHCEVEIETFGRQLEYCERDNLEKVIDLYSELKAPNGAISDEESHKVASLADQLGLRPAELMGKVGSDCLQSVNGKRRKKGHAIESISDLVRENRPMAPYRRSLRAFLTKFLSDRLSSRRKP
jgi:hypothetical protein